MALIYNGWSWYVLLANPKTWLEAKTSRPKLLSAVGRLTTHSRINTIVLALTHEAANQIKAMIVNVRAGVEHIRGAAPQLAGSQRWYALARYIADKILAFVPHTPYPYPRCSRYGVTEEIRFIPMTTLTSWVRALRTRLSRAAAHWPRCSALSSMSPQRCHALPAHRITAHSGASNCRF